MKVIQILPSAMAIGILSLSSYSHASDKLIPIEQLTKYPLELQTEFKESKELCKGAQYGVVEYESPLSAKPGYITNRRRDRRLHSQHGKTSMRVRCIHMG